MQCCRTEQCKHANCCNTQWGHAEEKTNYDNIIIDMIAHALNVTNASCGNVYDVIHNPVFQCVSYTIYVQSACIPLFPL